MGDVSGSKTVVNALKQQTLERLQPRLSLVIEETADYLFSLSTSTRLDPANQNHCYDAFVMLQAQTKPIVGQICSAVGASFDLLKDNQTGPTDAPMPEETAELALLDLEVFEETLAIEKIVRASTERFWVDLESLMFRLGSVLATPADTVKLPVSPYLLCSAYRQALRDIEFPRRFLIDADSAFARKLLPELADIYQSLNAYLKDMGLLPNIEEELTQTGSRILINHGNRQADSPRSTVKQSGPEIDEGAQLTDAADIHRLIHETDWINALSVDITASSVSVRPFSNQRVNEVPVPLDQLQAAGGKHTFIPTRIAPPNRDDASRNRLLSSTEHLLERRPPPSLEMESECLRVARALSKARSEEKQGRLDYEQLRELIGFEPQVAVAERLREAQKISAQLFNYLLDRLAPSNEQILVFANLELCFLELALVDPHFLIEGDHPGRLLVDRLTDLATLFPRGDTKYLDSLVNLMKELTTKFDGASSTLSAASNGLSELSLKLIKQQRQNKDRLITRENARDKIDHARLLLIETLNTKFTDKPAKQGLIDSVAVVFIDRWVVSLLKGTPISAIEGEIDILFQTAHDASDQLTLEQQIQHLADQVNLPSELTKEARQALEGLFLPSTDIGRVPDTWTLDIDLTPQQLDTLLSTRPRLKRAAAAIQKIPVETWFRYGAEQDYRYLQIVWVNRHGTRFVLTDERGLKQRDLSIIQLALELDRSLKRLSTVERLSLVEQTLFSKLSALQDDVSQRFSRASEDAASKLAHELERIARRIRRTSVNVFAVGFTLTEEISSHNLENALSDTKAPVGSICRLSNSRVCVLSSLEPEAIRKLVRATFGETEIYDFTTKELDETAALDIQNLIDALTAQDGLVEQATPPPNDKTVMPLILDNAVAEAVDQMAPHAQAIRLRSIIRVPVAHPENVEAAFRLESPYESSELLRWETASEQRSIRIASNLIELEELCKLLRDCERHQRVRPHLVLRLNADTCLHAGAQDRILSLISEYAVGTSQISFLISDSLQLRDSAICQRLTRALRSIGCHIVLDQYNPERAGEKSPAQLNATEIIIDSHFWERAAQSDPWKSLLPQLIADTHHILGQSVCVRNPSITDSIEQTGIDYIERESDVLLSTSELLSRLRPELV